MLYPEFISDAKPFLKWAGGKTQLIDDIWRNLPEKPETIHTYIEPFAGSGAVMFAMLKNFPSISKVVINDINSDLINAYRVIRQNPQALIERLKKIQNEYYLSAGETEKQEYFLSKRKIFNTGNLNDVEKTALLIFLNRTCFNGLYRVNSKNEFNVPHGRYACPTICDEKTILADSQLLQKVTVLNGDFAQTEKYIDGRTFFYFDPPYKPLNKTSSFTSYSRAAFGDSEQIRLHEFCKKLDSRGVLWLLSNSDPRNTDPENNFFDNLYRDFNISRVEARRHINAKVDKRGKINELMIRNY